MRLLARLLPVVLVVQLLGCGEGPETPGDGGSNPEADAGTEVDAGTGDAGTEVDAGTGDGGTGSENRAPQLERAEFDLPENSAVGSVVGTLAATELDEGQVLTFAITAGNDADAFSLDPVTGELRVGAPGPLDFETTPSFELTVVVTDDGVPALAATETVTVTLTDANEAPVLAPASFTLDEETLPGTAMGTLAATDVDQGQTLSFSITAGNEAGAFSLDAVTGELVVAFTGLLDFETTPSFALTVAVTDNGVPALSATETVIVMLTDVNEAPVLAPASFTLAENSVAGTVVGTLAATEVDQGQTHSFVITAGNDAGAFSLDAVTGVLRVSASAPLDFEVTPAFALTVAVTDDGVPALSATETVTVSLTDANDAPVLAPASFTLAENSAAGTALGTLMATDVDLGQTRSFAITGGNDAGAFSLDAVTGVLQVSDSAPLDFETTPGFALTVAVTDNGIPALSATETVIVTLTDVNEAPVLAPASFTLAENSAAGTVVGTLTATDVDQSQTRSFAITAGNGAGAFALDALTGVLSVSASAPLDFETTPSFALTVTVSDNGAPALTATQTVAVALTNVNEAPVIQSAQLILTLPTSSGAVVGVLAATDVDSGQQLAFSLVAGNDDGAFALDPVTGQLTVATAASLAMGTRLLTVEATDNGAPPLSATGTLQIDVTAPPIAVADGPLQVGAQLSATLNLLANDDLKGVPTLVTSFGGGALGGTVTQFPANGTDVAFAGGVMRVAADGSAAFEPNLPGTYEFRYRVANVAGAAEASVVVQVCANMAVGEVLHVRPEQASSTCVLNPAGSQANFGLVISNLTDDASYTFGITATGVLDTETTGAGSTTITAETHTAQRHASRLDIAARLSAGTGTGTPVVPAASIPNGLPAVGAAWRLNGTTDVACNSGESLSARVVAVGAHVIVVTDDANPQGGLTLADYQEVASTFDTRIHPAVAGTFGPPSDLDANGRVVLFYTAALNRLSPPASSAVEPVRFHTRDLVAQALCPTSNRGELIYLLAADPTGSINSNVRTVSFVKGLGESIAHEYGHLVVESNRLHTYGLTAVDEAWLSEGLAEAASEKVFFHETALPERSNIALSTLTTGPEASRRVAAFNTFENQTFGRLRLALQRPGAEGLFASGASSQNQRGHARAFLRYAADRRTQSDMLLHELAYGAQTGLANLQSVTGEDARLWVRDYLLSLYADDHVSSVHAHFTSASWNHRSVYGGLGGYPLNLRTLGSSTPIPTTLARGGGSSFLEFNIVAGGLGTIILTPPTGTYDAWYSIVRRQ